MALELRHAVETSLTTVSFNCISHSFYFNSYLKQLYISNKTERFSNKNGCGVMCIKAFQEELAGAIDRWLRVSSSSNIMLFKKVIALRN